MDSCMVVTLLRHGLTDFNEQKRYLGWTNVPISDKGREQLQSLKQKYIYPSPDLVFTSDLMRCMDTVNILFPNYTVRKFSSLREMHFGDWEGHTYEELVCDQLYRYWLEDQSKVTPPHGEAYLQFQERVLEGWNKVVTEAIELQAKHVVLVSHGGPIRFLLSHFTSTGKSFWDWNIDYGQGYSLIASVAQKRRQERWNLLQEAPSMAKGTGSIRTIK